MGGCFARARQSFGQDLSGVWPAAPPPRPLFRLWPRGL